MTFLACYAYTGSVTVIQVDTAKIGRLGGQARARNLTAKERSESSRKAAQAKWEAYYAEHPEKRKTARTAASRNKVKKKAKK